MNTEIIGIVTPLKLHLESVPISPQNFAELINFTYGSVKYMQIVCL